MARNPWIPRPTSAVAVINPDAPEADKQLLRTARRNPAALDLSGSGAPTHTKRIVVAVVSTTALGAYFVTHRFGSSDRPIPGVLLARIHDALSTAETVIGWGALVAGMATAAYGVLLVTGRARRRRLTERYWAAVRDHVVDPEELTDECRGLLARGQKATTTVMRSRVHRHGLIDKAHNEAALPRQEWELATTLRDYSRLAGAEPGKPAGAEVVTLLQRRRDALRASLDGVERRVVALEKYADQVVEADRRYEEWKQIEELSEDADAVLDLLARTARDDMAVAEIEGLTGQAAAVAESLTTALESARKAAFVALPPPAATA
ncbi:hypothetical protein Sdia_38000 [Streptomyces diastaticus subsp. diastaticus]|uniref:5-bromo-4-chloroindolyl phosphate hydrolysis protein n=1 Tax=Streptomyces diastaticus subsp. diastaticus TaxID=68040 RepID=A0ABQ1CRM8_STRDI|nr:hypothetical protein Sdia_38000 [Streptomyces diastaticus subsp. diastaticus]GGU25598.1 hypothetical protein GCM10015534_30300 [Streptomyces diastaticus subsp. diastaticus]